MAEVQQSYPAIFIVDYPDKPRNRLTTFFRLFTAIPIVIILSLLTESISTRWGTDVTGGWHYAGYGIGFLVMPTLLMILFRQKYPRWWFDWNLNLMKFASRVSCYMLLFRDEYPSTDEEQAVHIAIPYPDVKKELTRWLPLFKWIMAIPHFIVLFFLDIALVVVSFIAWWAILIVGRYPRDLFNFAVGVFRWWLRVDAYAILLTTDKYPPFRLAP